MRFEWDEAKRAQTLHERGLDFVDAVHVFNSLQMQLEDDRSDYGERRLISFGYLGDRAVAVVWTKRGAGRRIISMRHVHDRELEARQRAMD